MIHFLREQTLDWSRTCTSGAVRNRYGNELNPWILTRRPVSFSLGLIIFLKQPSNCRPQIDNSAVTVSEHSTILFNFKEGDVIVGNRIERPFLSCIIYNIWRKNEWTDVQQLNSSLCRILGGLYSSGIKNWIHSIRGFNGHTNPNIQRGNSKINLTLSNVVMKLMLQLYLLPNACYNKVTLLLSWIRRRNSRGDLTWVLIV